jgi:hypothetical protein
MIGWIKLATFVAVAAILATATGGAGATATPKNGTGVKSNVVSHGSVSALSARRAALLRSADLSTRAGAVRYLRAIGIDPRHVVIQRGARNYAGPKCPGSGWSCTKARRVLQIGTDNAYTCSPKQSGAAPNSCVIMQSGGGTATCTETSAGPTQRCTITQSSLAGGGANRAFVTQRLGQFGTGNGTQDGTQNASIVQASQGGANSISVTQELAQRLGRGSDLSDEGDNDADDFTPAISSPISQTQDAHQNLDVRQTSASGANASTIFQLQLQVERADHAPKVTQSQNTSVPTGTPTCSVLSDADDPAANQCNAVRQSSTSGTNNLQVRQSYNQLQAASNCCATMQGSQVQGVKGKGGLDHRFQQSSGGVSTQSSNQIERQIQRRFLIGAAGMMHEHNGPIGVGLAPGADPGSKATGRSLQQTRKGTGMQSGNADDRAEQNQSSTQISTPVSPGNDTNVLSDQCTSSGNCKGTQTTNENGTTTTNTQTASTIILTTNCAPTCTTQPPIIFDGSPGSAPPPATLGPYTMTAFGLDPQPINDGAVTGVSDPAGTLAFTPPLNHSRVGNGWSTWSHGYTGDVYWTPSGGPITITLPAGTRAFYVYAEPNTFALFDVTATAQDGTTSGPVQVQGEGGAKYFGFYATGTPNIASISVTTTDTSGLGVGEFGIAPAAAPPIG